MLRLVLAFQPADMFPDAVARYYAAEGPSLDEHCHDLTTRLLASATRFRDLTGKPVIVPADGACCLARIVQHTVDIANFSSGVATWVHTHVLEPCVVLSPFQFLFWQCWLKFCGWWCLKSHAL